MLDYAYRLEFSPLVASVPHDPRRTQDAGTRASPATLRRLIDRLAGRPVERRPDAADPADEASLPSPAARRDADLRARAHAAWRTVDGAEERALDGAAGRALDVALGVMEAEIATLRDAVQAYGETLKSIEVYARDDTARAAARAALRARPQRLLAAPPIPRLAAGGADREVRP